MANNRTAAGEIIKILGARDQRKNIAQITKRERGGASSWTDLSNHHTSHQTGGEDVISVDDDMIGNRTLTDADASTGNTGKITILFGWLANMIKQITGKANWRTAPAISLEATNTHVTHEAIHVHLRVRLASTAAITLSGTQTVDGIATNGGDRILIKDQADKKTNGIYVASSSGAWSRASDFDAAADIVSGAAIYVMTGSTLAKKVYNLTSVDPTLGTDDLVFEEVTGGGGGGGLPINWLGAYAAGTTYAKNDGVTDLGTSYVSLQDTNTGNTPASSPTYWEIVAAKGDTGAMGAIGDYAENSGSHSGLDFAYNAGKVRTNNVIHTTSAGSITLANNTTNYIEVNPTSGAVSTNTSDFTSDRTPLFTVVTSGGAISTVTDCRCFFFNSGGTGIAWFSTVSLPTITSVTTGLAITAITKP